MLIKDLRLILYSLCINNFHLLYLFPVKSERCICIQGGRISCKLENTVEVLVLEAPQRSNSHLSIVGDSSGHG